MRDGGIWPARNALALLVAAVIAMVVPVHASQAAVPEVVDVIPPPAAVVDAGPMAVTAWVASDAEPTGVEVTVAGTPVEATVRSAGEGTGAWEVRADPVDVVAGRHEVVVRVTVGGDQAVRRWSVTATDVVVERLAGDDRHATAVAISRRLIPTGTTAGAVVLARSDAFADALAGSPLAAHVDGPLLLTPRDQLHPATEDEVQRVLPEGGTVHVLGGEAAIAVTVTEHLTDLGYRVVRHAGPDRYATAAAVADELPASTRAWIASGESFPDALAISVPATRAIEPVLLTRRDALPVATRDALSRADTAIVAGGVAAVATAVVDELRSQGLAVTRTAGADRYATAAAVARAWSPAAGEATLAVGDGFADALAGGRLAAVRGAPLLLVARLGGTGGPSRVLPAPTDDAVRRITAARVTVLGGPTAVPADAAEGARLAATDGSDAPVVVAADPPPGVHSDVMAPVVLELDRAVEQDTLEVSVTLDGVETPTTVRLATDGRTVVLDPLPPGDRPLLDPLAVTVRLRSATSGGAVGHHRHTFALAPQHRVMATVGDLVVREPSRAVELVGYHQSNHEGARDMTHAADGPPHVLMDGRDRLAGRWSAADVVAAEDVPIMAPVTGTVVRAGSYVLYCRYTDHYVAIEPDGMPGWEVKLLHFKGLQVQRGERVATAETVIGTGPRPLPFESQVDEYSSSGRGPHVHLEVVDTSIPNVPNGGSGGC